MEGEEAMEEKLGSEEKAFHIIGMKLVTTSLNIYHVKGDTVWCMDTISESSENCDLEQKHLLKID